MTEEKLSPLLRESSAGVLIPCWIQPRASKNSIAGIHGDAVKISLTAPPVDGKANAELCKFFADILDLPKSAITLESGQTSRNKRILIKNLTSKTILKLLCKDG